MESKINVSNAQNIDRNRCVLSGHTTFFCGCYLNRWHYGLSTTNDDEKSTLSNQRRPCNASET